MLNHRLAEERSLEIHRLVAERLRADPSLVESARARVERWLADGSIHRTYAGIWAELLAGPLDDLVAMLVSATERARALRQCSPFAGVIDPRTRWRTWREVRERMEARG
jgi:hypothetical protein